MDRSLPGVKYCPDASGQQSNQPANLLPQFSGQIGSLAADGTRKGTNFVRIPSSCGSQLLALQMLLGHLMSQELAFGPN